MQFDDQLMRYFASRDLTSVSPEVLAAGVEHVRVDLGLETDSARRFALWAILFMLNAAPELESTFKNAAEREAARNFMDLMGAETDASS